jgi:hypothetical protein
METALVKVLGVEVLKLSLRLLADYRAKGGDLDKLMNAARANNETDIFEVLGIQRPGADTPKPADPATPGGGGGYLPHPPVRYYTEISFDEVDRSRRMLRPGDRIYQLPGGMYWIAAAGFGTTVPQDANLVETVQ